MEINMEQSKLIYETDARGVTSVVRCVPKDGVYLFEINATYAKSIPPSTYYELGKTKKEAKHRFQRAMTWMTITSIRMVPPDEAESILTNPMKMPMR